MPVANERSADPPGREEAGGSQTDLAHLEWLADLGELAAPVMHEFNNFLNTTILQITILERQAAPEVVADLAELRRQCREVTGVIRRWQQQRHHRPVEPGPVDLNAAVRAAVGRVSAERSRSVHLHA